MIECIITSSVLIVVIIFLRFLFRGKISRRLQYALWGLVLLRLLVPFSLFESSLSIMNVVPYNSFSERQVYILPISKQPVNKSSGMVINRTDTAVDTNSFGYAVLSEDGTTITRYAEKMNIGKILSLIWLLGSIVVGMWFIGINFGFYKRLRKTRQAYQSINCKLPIYITEHIASPCLFGILYPAIYMTPKAVESESSRRHVITHELCHYRHGDHIWSILRGLCLAGWWWNPLVWAAAIFSREDSELACDEAVIKKIGVENRFSYGHTFVDMIAIRKSPTGLMCAATTMISGKRSLKERLNMIIKNPKTVIPAMISVLLIVAVCVGCTFTSASKNTKEQDLPAVDMVFSSDNYNDLEKLGRDAATFYYSQFMEGTIPQYWHITKHETLSCQLIAGNEMEFAVWVTSYIETNGAGFLVGQGIPHDPDDITKGGICPEVGKQLRIKALGDGKYEIVSIGTGGGTQGLIPVERSVTYGNDTQLAEDTVMSVDRTNLEACLSEAILAANKDHYHNGDFAAEAHSLLKTIEKDNITTVYAMALFVEFGYAGGGFSETGGSHMPVAIVFEKNNAGEYELQEYWTPQDGSYYAQSIKERFPSDIYEDALDTQKYILAHKQACYEQAIQYGNVHVDNEIKLLIETISSSPAQMSNPLAYIQAHQVEYRKLIYYGQYTLRYCSTLFEQGGQTGLDGHIMAMACREILGDVKDDVQYNTGQEWYDTTF